MSESSISTNMTSLFELLQNGAISRRSFVRRATALGVSASVAASMSLSARAQDSSPEASAVVSGPVTTSVTRDEYYQKLAEAYPLEEIGVTGGQFIYAQTSDIQVLNPTLVQDTYSAYITGNLFNSLIQSSAIDGTYVPDLADYWEVSADGLIYTFYLSQTATWHDGQPVTAADVVFSFDSIIDPTSLSVRQSDVTSVVASYQALDDYTFEVTASAPVVNFLDNGPNNVTIIPKHVWESVPFADFAADPGSTGLDPARVVGSGPFRFVEWVPADHVTIAKNEAYWDTPRTPNLDTFTYRVIPEPAASVQALITGEIDGVEIPIPQVDSLKESNPELQLTISDTLNFTYYSPNLDPARTTLFLDVRVRQALMYALDRELAAEQVLFGYGIRADGTQPVLSVAYAPDQVNTIYSYDPEKAKSLLEEAGWIDSDGDGVREKDGVKLSFEVGYAEGEQTYIQLLPYMQQAWGEVGIESAPTALPFPTLVEQFTTGQFDLVVIGFSWTVDGDQGAMFRSDTFAPNGFNCAHYSNPEYDRLNNEQGLELDPVKRKQLLVDQSNIINDEQPVGILFFSKEIQAAQPTIHNYLPNGYSVLWSLPWTWIEE